MRRTPQPAPGRRSPARRPPGARVAARALPRPSGIITLLTDFGLDDPYVGIVKGVILGINPRARLVDLAHAIPPQDVRRGALALESAYRFFPLGTVHLAVVDPGVGGARRALAVRAGGHVFVGPDNGLLGFLFDRPDTVAVALTNPSYRRSRVSRTFHARDVFAPAAAACSLGVSLGRLGPPVRDPVRLPRPRVRRKGGRMVGEVLRADRFGNLLTNLTEVDLPGAPEACQLRVSGMRVDGLVATYGERPIGALGALIDSSGWVEIFVRNGSAQARLRVGPGAPVSLWSRSTSSRRARTTSRGSKTAKMAKTTKTRSRRRSPRRSRPSRRPFSRTPWISSGTRTGSR